MDNIEINMSDEKIYIKKGKVKKDFLYNTIFLSLLISTLITFFLLKYEINDEWRFKFEKEFFKLMHLSFILSFSTFLTCVSIFFISFLRNFHLEIILLTNKVKIIGINYEININFKSLKEIKVCRYYRANYNFFDKGTYYSHFRDKCTIIFITENNETYEWGYTLSYQKGMEIKKIIEDKIKLESAKSNE